MGNTPFLATSDALGLQVSILRRADVLFRSHTLPSDSSMAKWMMMHHGDLTTRMYLPWKCMLEQSVPQVIAMWTIPPVCTEDDIGGTIYVAERNETLVVYLVEKRNACYNIDAVLNALHNKVWLFWRNGACRVCVQHYLYAANRIRLQDTRLYEQLMSKQVKVAVRNLQTGTLLPDHTLSVFATYLNRPLIGEMDSAVAEGLWTKFIEELQTFLCLLQLAPAGSLKSVVRFLVLWVQVYLERMLVTPATMVPHNGPPVVLNLMDQLEGMFQFHAAGSKQFRSIYSTYAELLGLLSRYALGKDVVVLEDRHYRAKPPQMDEKTLVVWLQFWRRDIGFSLQQLASQKLSKKDHYVTAESLLKYLAWEAVPQDQRHGWVEDIPWHRIVQIILDTLPNKTVPKDSCAQSHLVRLGKLLDMALAP